MSLDLNSQLNMSRLTSMQSQNAASQMVQNAADKANAAGRSAGQEEEINEELMGACKQFEAYFLEQVFKEMEKSVKVFSKDKQDQSLGTLVDYFKDMTLQNVTSLSADKQSVGMAKMMYENLKNNYYASTIPVADAAAVLNAASDNTSSDEQSMGDTSDTTVYHTILAEDDAS